MARHAIWLERVAGVSVESLGRGGLDRQHSYMLEATGRHLFYSLNIDGGWIFVSAGPMDTGDSEFLVSMADGKAGWNACSRLILALERSGRHQAAAPSPRARPTGQQRLLCNRLTPVTNL